MAPILAPSQEVTMKWYLSAPVLLALAACGTPQEQCMRMASHDMVVLDRLIAETQGNIARGYGFAQTVVEMPEFVLCETPIRGDEPGHRSRTCIEDVPHTVTKPVALDLQAEAAKLASMQKRRAEMAKALAPAFADCQARYPE
jgi:hypothetical protein